MGTVTSYNERKEKDQVESKDASYRVGTVAPQRVVSSMVEQSAFNRLVVGSSPTRPIGILGESDMILLVAVSFLILFSIVSTAYLIL